MRLRGGLCGSVRWSQSTRAGPVGSRPGGDRLRRGRAVSSASVGWTAALGSSVSPRSRVPETRWRSEFRGEDEDRSAGRLTAGARVRRAARAARRRTGGTGLRCERGLPRHRRRRANDRRCGHDPPGRVHVGVHLGPGRRSHALGSAGGARRRRGTRLGQRPTRCHDQRHAAKGAPVRRCEPGCLRSSVVLLNLGGQGLPPRRAAPPDGPPPCWTSPRGPDGWSRWSRLAGCLESSWAKRDRDGWLDFRHADNKMSEASRSRASNTVLPIGNPWHTPWPTDRFK